MNNFIIASLSCQKNRNKIKTQENTWMKDIPKNIKHFIVEGNHSKTELNGNILEIGLVDDYDKVVYKMYESYKFMLNYDWDYLIKIDDDVYLDVYKLLEYEFPKNYDGCAILYDKVHVSGPFFMVTRKAIELAVEKGIDENMKPYQYKFVPEDYWLCKTMLNNGMKFFNDYLFGGNIIHYKTKHFGESMSFQELMAISDNVLACFEMESDEMVFYHEFIKAKRKVSMNPLFYRNNSGSLFQ